MEIQVQKKELLAAINALSRTAPRKSTMSICECLELRAEWGRLRLTATNLDVTHAIWVEGILTTEGALAVPCRTLGNVVKSFSEGELTLSTKGNQLTISGEGQQVSLIGDTAEDFPPMPEPEVHTIGTVSTPELSRALKEVLVAVSEDSLRPVLSTVNCRIFGNTMTLAATDGYEMAISQLDVEGFNLDFECNIPVKVVQILLATLKDKEPITLAIGKTKIQFSKLRQSIIAFLYQGNFPNYAELVPTEADHLVTLSRLELLKKIDCAMAVAKKKVENPNLVRLEASLDLLSVRARNEAGDKYDADIVAGTALYFGKACRVAFNGKWLSEMLRSLPDETVEIAINSQSSPARIRPIGRDNYTYIIMPMFTTWDI